MVVSLFYETVFFFGSAARQNGIAIEDSHWKFQQQFVQRQGPLVVNLAKRRHKISQPPAVG